MLPFKRPFDSIDHLHAERLECLSECWHRELAVFVALAYCAEHGLGVPRWAVEEAPDVLANALAHHDARLGRAANAIARYRQDMIDFTRFEAVCDVRENQKELPEVVKDLRSRKGVPPALMDDREKMAFWVGRTWLRAYECASMILSHTEAHGGPDAMKTSYLQVRRNNRDPSQALRYHLLESCFLRQLGLDTDFERKRRPKIVPYYELTL